MSVGWSFPKTPAGEYEGFNHPGIAIFAGKPVSSLVREVLQNSLDAQSGDEKVTVEFDIVEIESKKNELGIEDLRREIKQCREDNVGLDDKAKAALDKALALYQSKKIACLQITDFSTTGLQGALDDPNGQWFALIKASGKGVKQDDTAGGSFGIGKNAPFAISDLRTVFYSTRYRERNGEAVERAQGKSVWLSRRLEGGFTSATGYYGTQEDYQPLTGSAVPEHLKLKEQGTRLLVAGFDASNSDWRQRIIATVLTNFFYAIAEGQLEVLIGNGEDKDPDLIDSGCIEQAFEAIEDAQSDSDDREDIQDARRYYNASVQGDHYETELQHLGHCRMWLQIEEGAQSQVALLRKGMLITDDYRGLRKRKWAKCEDFAATVICESKAGQALLRRMENPQHNSFEPDALKDEAALGKQAMKQLTSWVRKTIQENASSEEPVAESDLKELAEFFPDIDPEERLLGEGDEADLEGGAVYHPKPPAKRKPKVNEPGETGDDEDLEEPGRRRRRGRRRGTRGGEDGKGSRLEAVQIMDPRIKTGEDKKQRTVLFTPNGDGEAEVYFRVAGDNLVEAERIQFKVGQKKFDTAVSVTLEKGTRYSMDITIKESIEAPIQIVVAKRISQ